MSKLPISNPLPHSLRAAQQPAPLAIRRALRQTVLAYHELLPERAAYRYALSSGDFEEHLWLAAQLASSPGYSSPPLIFSFDDGHISNFSTALPLLQKYCCKAIFFV